MHLLPDAHQSFLNGALPVLQSDARVQAVVVSGSAVTGGVDVWSDLDLVVLVEDAAEAALTGEHFAIVERMGTLLQAFRADHLGEPRLLICLYDTPLLHVDVKFLAYKDVHTLRYAAEVLWARSVRPDLPGPGAAREFNVQWCADRLPGWAHYLGIKIGRGELFEALNSLDFLRTRVLAPLIALEAGTPPRGLRRLEETKSPRLASLARTTCAYDRAAIAAASGEAIELASSLLDVVGPNVNRNRHAEHRATTFLNEVRRS
jgi:predicted nucleotidyltransferase